MRVITVPFHEYVPRGITPYYKIYFDYFLKKLRIFKDEFDIIYFEDHGWGFKGKDYDDIRAIVGDRFVIEEVEGIHSWVHNRNFLAKTEADKVLLLDQDNFIYRPRFVKEHFDLLDEFDLVSMFDGSGTGEGLRESIWKRYPMLAEKGYVRIGSYMTFLKRDLLKGFDLSQFRYEPGTYIPELNYTTVEGDFLDSFGDATIKILAKDPKVFFVEDDRSSIYINEDGKVNTMTHSPLNTGCYHLRNWSLGLHLINERKRDRESYDKYRAITPVTEACRLLGWLWVLAESMDKLSNNMRDDILTVTKDYGIKKDDWFEYVLMFREYHPWI